MLYNLSSSSKKCYILALFLTLVISSCNQKGATQEVKSKDSESLFEVTSTDTISLPVLDLQKKYPKKTVDLQDIADVEYIVLETHDEGLVTGALNTIITDSLIITYSGLKDDILFFQRNGKFFHSFNRKGNSGMEYAIISDLRINDSLKEVYINDNLQKKIQVYSYEGDYKRTIRFNDKTYRMGSLFNYNNEYLFVEDWYNVDYEGNPPTNPQPYYKVSLENETMTRLPLIVNQRTRDRQCWYNDETGETGIIGVSLSPITYINDELIIADYALDTVYTYRDDKLRPIAVRKNQFKENGILWITTLDIVTDKYYIWQSVEKDFKKMALPDKKFIQDKQTGACLEIKFTDCNITDIDFEFRHRMSANDFTVPQNHALQYYPAENLIELNEAGKLQGKLKEIASKLTFDDNPVLMLAKFK